MAQIVAQFYEGGAWRVQFRLYAPDGSTLEPFVSVPMDVWLAHDELGQTQLVESGLAFVALHYPDYSEEQPDGRH